MKIHLFEFGEGHEFLDAPTLVPITKPSLPKPQAAELAPIQRARISCLRRSIGQHDDTRIWSMAGVVVRDSMIEFGELDPVAELGVSIVTPLESKELYERYFSRYGYQKGAKKFNSRVKRCESSMNQDNPMVFAQLGEVGVYGAQGLSNGGLRHVGPRLVGEGADTLCDETTEFLSKISRGRIAAKPIHDREFEPHLSMVKTHDPGIAREMAGRLSDVNLEGLWVQLVEAQTRPVSIWL